MSTPANSQSPKDAEVALPSALTTDNIIEVWKKTIEVQQHFNDLELRIRNYAVTVLVGILGVAGFSLKERILVVIFGKTMMLAVWLLFAGAVGWVAFYFMDRYWYHRLLYGAVKHAQKIENAYATTFSQIGLTNTIGAESPIKVKGIEIRTTAKIDIFYGAILLILLVMIVGLYFSSFPPPAGAIEGAKGTERPSAESKSIKQPEPSPQPKEATPAGPREYQPTPNRSIAP